ncbi:MAG: hypothetical protein MJ247_01400 [Alphaproteobacteria bacterium]|nr:hypothetical protein [Alphaproteobacteria bacterium]
MICKFLSALILSISFLVNPVNAKSVKLGASEALSDGTGTSDSSWSNISDITYRELSANKCLNDEDCPSHRECLDGECVDICLNNPCQSKTDGRTVCTAANHVAICSCDNTSCKKGYRCVSKSESSGGKIVSKRQCEICPEGSSNSQCGCESGQVADGKGGCKCGGVDSCKPGYKFVYSGSSCGCSPCTSSDATDNSYCNCYSNMHWISTKQRCVCKDASDMTCYDVACTKDADCGATACNGQSHCVLKKCDNGYCKSAACGGMSEWDSCEVGYQCINPESYENAACVICSNGEPCVTCRLKSVDTPISGGDGKCYEDCSKVSGYTYNLQFKGCVKDSTAACPEGCSYKSVCTGDLIAPANDRYVVEVKSKRGTGNCVLCSSVIPHCTSCQRKSIYHDVVNCTVCEDDYELKNNECVLSPRVKCFRDGLAYDAATDSCYRCEDNEVFDAETGTCYECDKGTFPSLEGGVLKCVPCSSKFGPDCISCTVNECEKCGINGKDYTSYYGLNKTQLNKACMKCGGLAYPSKYCTSCSWSACLNSGNLDSKCPSTGKESETMTIASGTDGEFCYYSSEKDMIIGKTTRKSMTYAAAVSVIRGSNRFFQEGCAEGKSNSDLVFKCMYKYSGSVIEITIKDFF